MTRISKVLVLLVCAVMGVAGLEPPTYSACDINQNGRTDVVDVETMIEQTLGLVPATNDLSGDGAVTAVDVQIDITAALGGVCLAAGPHAVSIASLPISLENSTSVAPTGPMTYVVDGAPVAVENTTSVTPTGPMTYVADGAPVAIENTVPVTPTGPMTYVAAGAPVAVENSVSVTPPSPQSYYISGLYFTIFNGLTPTSFLSNFGAPSLRFRLPVDPTFLAEALARGAQRIDGKPVCVDTDGDGICDADELIIGTSPYLADTDGDGYPDGLELALGSDPLDPKSIPDLRPPGYFATPPVSIENLIQAAILNPKRRGVTDADENR